MQGFRGNCKWFSILKLAWIGVFIHSFNTVNKADKVPATRELRVWGYTRR